MTVSNYCSMSRKENGAGESVDRWSRGASIRRSDIRIRNWKLSGWFTLLVTGLLLHTSLDLVFMGRNHISKLVAGETKPMSDDAALAELVALGEAARTKLVPAFVRKPRVVTASVNAGDHGLCVGGSGCDGSFFEVLKQAGQDPNNYHALHKAAVELRKRENTTSDVITVMKPKQIAPYSEDVAILAYKPLVPPPEGNTSRTTGSVFISIFKPDKRPFGKANNYAMIYAVAPSGDSGFHADVRRTAENIMDSVCQTRLLLKDIKDANGNPLFPPIKRIRMPLISGDAGRHEQVPPVMIAIGILSGLEGRRRDISPEIQFINDGGVFPLLLGSYNSTLSIVGQKRKRT